MTSTGSATPGGPSSFDPDKHPRDRSGEFTQVLRDEADVDALDLSASTDAGPAVYLNTSDPRNPFSLYPDTGDEPSDEFAGTPVHRLENLAPGMTTHVAIGPGRRWATVCGDEDPRTGETCGALLFAEDPGALNSAKGRHQFTEHRTKITDRHVAPDGAVTEVEVVDEVGLQVDEWVVDERSGIRVCFTNLDEGWDGEYDPEDPEDANLLRIDVNVRPEHPDADMREDADLDGPNGHWYWPEGTGSWCTQVRAEHVTPQQLRRLARQALQDLASRTRDGGAISPLIDSFQGMSERDAPAYQGDDPSEVGKQQMLATMIAEGRYASVTPTSVAWCDSCGSYEGHREPDDLERGYGGLRGPLCVNCDDKRIP